MNSSNVPVEDGLRTSMFTEEFKSLRQEVLDRLGRVAKYHHGLLIGTGYYALTEFLLPSAGSPTTSPSAAGMIAGGPVAQSILLMLPFLALAVDIACASETDAVRRAGIYIRDQLERPIRGGLYHGWESWLTARDLTHRRRTADRMLDLARRSIVLVYCVLSSLVLSHALTSPVGMIDSLHGASQWTTFAYLTVGYVAIAVSAFWLMNSRRAREFTPAQYDTLVLDVDGCLLTPGKDVAQSDAAGLLGLRDKGITVTLASGRGSHSLAAIARSSQLSGWHVASHGSTLVHIGRTGKAAFEHLAPLTLAQVRHAHDRLRAQFPDLLWVAVQADGDHYCRKPHIDGVRRLLIERHDLPEAQAGERVKDLDGLPSDSQEPFEKILIYSKRRDSLDGRIMALLDSATFRIVRTTGDTIEIAHATASKVNALQEILLRTGRTSKSVVACGDDDNDVEMLQWARLGVCPRDAVPHVRNIPGVVCLPQTSDTEFVASVCRTYFGAD